MHLSGAISGFVSYLINTVGDFPLTYGWEVIDKDSAVGGGGGGLFYDAPSVAQPSFSITCFMYCIYHCY